MNINFFELTFTQQEMLKNAMLKRLASLENARDTAEEDEDMEKLALEAKELDDALENRATMIDYSRKYKLVDFL